MRIKKRTISDVRPCILSVIMRCITGARITMITIITAITMIVTITAIRTPAKSAIILIATSGTIPVMTIIITDAMQKAAAM